MFARIFCSDDVLCGPRYVRHCPHYGLRGLRREGCGLPDAAQSDDGRKDDVRSVREHLGKLR